MKNMSSHVFMYPYWMKWLGGIFVIAAVGMFLFRIYAYDIVDIPGASTPVAIGLIMIFFSRSKIMDERSIYLKFKSLAIAVPVVGLVVMLINYSMNFSSYSVEKDMWISISAFEYLSLTLLLALSINQYLSANY